MNLSEENKYINFLKKQAIERHCNHISICLFGGEPLINFDIAKYILGEIEVFCKENDLTYSCFVITNGTLLSKEVLEDLIYHNCNMIQVTLDGVRETHDSRRMYKNDRGSTESCAAYSGHCLVEEEIGETLYDLWSAAEAEGFKYNIRPTRKWLYCGLYSDNQFTVTPECDIYKCWEHTGQKEHLMGTLNDDGNIVNIKPAFFEWMSHDPISIEECKDCVYLPVCGGGCGVISYNKCKTYHASGCFKVKGVVENNC